MPVTASQPATDPSDAITRSADGRKRIVVTIEFDDPRDEVTTLSGAAALIEASLPIPGELTVTATTGQ